MKKVFVIEDESSFIELYSEIFPRYGYEVVGWAYDGFEAIDRLSSMEPPDLVLIDYRLPMKNGIETMKILLESDPDVPVIFISADGSIRAKSLDEGARAFLQKPFNLDELIEIMKKHSR